MAKNIGKVKYFKHVDSDTSDSLIETQRYPIHLEYNYACRPDTDSSRRTQHCSTYENKNVEDKFSWRDGRRIVELAYLADQLCCKDCNTDLHLRNTTTETRFGYGSILYISCECGLINSVETNKSHRAGVNIRGPKVFDINTKAALGKCLLLLIYLFA